MYGGCIAYDLAFSINAVLTLMYDTKARCSPAGQRLNGAHYKTELQQLQVLKCLKVITNIKVPQDTHSQSGTT